MGSNSRQRLLTPHCMRITEAPMPVPPRAIDELLSALHAQPPAPENDLGMLRELALQVWRLEKRIAGVPPSADSKHKRQLEDSANRLRTLLEQRSITIDDPHGRVYLDGWIEVEVLAFEEPDGPPPEGASGQWIKQTIRPIIRGISGLIAKGEVIVASVETNRPS